MGNEEYVLKSLDGLGDVQYFWPSRSQYPTTYSLWTPVNISVLVTQPLFLNAFSQPVQLDNYFFLSKTLEE